MAAKKSWLELFMWERTGSTVRRKVCNYIVLNKSRSDSKWVEMQGVLDDWMRGNSIPNCVSDRFVGRDYWCDYRTVYKLPVNVDPKRISKY